MSDGRNPVSYRSFCFIRIGWFHNTIRHCVIYGDRGPVMCRPNADTFQISNFKDFKFPISQISNFQFLRFQISNFTDLFFQFQRFHVSKIYTADFWKRCVCVCCTWCLVVAVSPSRCWRRVRRGRCWRTPCRSAGARRGAPPPPRRWSWTSSPTATPSSPRCRRRRSTYSSSSAGCAEPLCQLVPLRKSNVKHQRQQNQNTKAETVRLVLECRTIEKHKF